MKTLRITTAALAITLGMGISSTSQAFMASPAEAQTIKAETELTDTLDSLRQEIAAGETEIDVMVTKLDAFVKHIDNMLDEGVHNEDLFLAAREEAITLRQSLPGLDKYLAGLDGAPVGGNIVGESVLSAPISNVSGGFVSSGGGFVAGGSAGGGAIGGASGLGLLGAIGAAIAIPVATSDDDSPVASPSLTSN